MITKAKILAALEKHKKHHVFEDQEEMGYVEECDFDKVVDDIITAGPRIMPAKWVTFTKTGESESGKTSIYQVRSKELSVLVGEIKWDMHLRGYSFFPLGNSLFDFRTLQDISNFLEAIMFLKNNKPSHGIQGD